MSEHPRARMEGIVTEELGDELMVYDGATQTAHALSRDAASVWRRCDGDSSATEIARGLGLDEARVAQALDDLSAAQLIEEPDRISRRTLHKRTAKLGAAALIFSVAIPPALAHASANPDTCHEQFGLGAGGDASAAQASANRFCATLPGCRPTSTCDCTPFENDPPFWQCAGLCVF